MSHLMNISTYSLLIYIFQLESRETPRANTRFVSINHMRAHAELPKENTFSFFRTLKHNTNTQDCKAGRVRAPACHVEKTKKGQGAYLEKETGRQQHKKYER